MKWVITIWACAVAACGWTLVSHPTFKTKAACEAAKMQAAEVMINSSPMAITNVEVFCFLHRETRDPGA